MFEESNLYMVLRFIDDHWERLLAELTSDQIKTLKSALETLRNEANSAQSINELMEPAIEFFHVLSHIEPLSFLGNTQGSRMRSLSPKKKQEDLQIKILNYCGILIEKIAKHEELE